MCLRWKDDLIIHPSRPLTASGQTVNKPAQPFLITPSGESDLLCRLVKMFFCPPHSAFPLPLSPLLLSSGAFDSYIGTGLSSRALGKCACVKYSPFYPDAWCRNSLVCPNTMFPCTPRHFNTAATHSYTSTNYLDFLCLTSGFFSSALLALQATHVTRSNLMQ